MTKPSEYEFDDGFEVLDEMPEISSGLVGYSQFVGLSEKEFDALRNGKYILIETSDSVIAVFLKFNDHTNERNQHDST